MPKFNCGLVELKLAAPDSGVDAMSFEGYGAVFGNVDSYGDVIAPGAFAAYLADVEAGKQNWPAMLLQHGGYGMTATLDVLEAMARGAGPSQALLALGYAGWSPGQLETEIARNDWLTVESAPGLIFSDDNGGKWSGALRSMGIDPLTLSAVAGRA